MSWIARSIESTIWSAARPDEDGHDPPRFEPFDELRATTSSRMLGDVSLIALAALCATGIFTALLVVAEYRSSDRVRWVAKPLASMSFVAFAVACGAIASTYGRIVLVALTLSWIGDVLLIPKNAAIFRAGVGAFLAAHLAFVVAFFAIGLGPIWIALACLVPVAAASLFVAARILPHVPPELRGAVGAYVVIISLMLACASCASFEHRRPLLFVAALGFYVSDLSVARDKFIAPGFMNRAWGLPLYYAAQLAFAWSTR